MWPVDEADDDEDPPVPDFIATEARFGTHNYEPIGVILSRDEGVSMWDAQGKRYLDCLSAYSAVNQGHCHPKSWPLWWNRPAS
jgi:ornithine--oxo-acid transaminase